MEVQFKNTRKGYYLNSSKIPLEKGDLVAVEASPGHDIGTVTLTGKLVLLQMKKSNVRTGEGNEPKKVYRKAKPTDIEKYEEAKAKEHATMIRSRQIAADLGLNMKIGDVEYQGDGNKAIFYYIADERVDFRQLIKVLAEAFRVRIEMKQIGARQEAGRIGGIGPCGRELCCSSWMTSFVSVATGAARYQDISMNPQKLAGQCAKLKCCINYEVDAAVSSFLPDNPDLARLHGFQCILMTLRCYTCAACGINTDRHFRKGCLDQQSIGDHTDICAKSHKSNTSDSFIFIDHSQFPGKIGGAEGFFINGFCFP